MNLHQTKRRMIISLGGYVPLTLTRNHRLEMGSIYVILRRFLVCKRNQVYLLNGYLRCFDDFRG